MSLIGNPAIIILDEPSANLDMKSRLRVWKAIHHIREGRTILIATQIIEEAEILCERICLLKDGAVLAIDGINDLKNQHYFDLKLDVIPIMTEIWNIKKKSTVVEDSEESL
jgi:ABC-2 type transport system ATP-binding protein